MRRRSRNSTANTPPVVSSETPKSQRMLMGMLHDGMVRRQMKQSELAVLSGYKPPYISQLLSGQRNGSYEAWDNLLDIVGCDYAGYGNYGRSTFKLPVPEGIRESEKVDFAPADDPSAKAEEAQRVWAELGMDDEPPMVVHAVACCADGKCGCACHHRVAPDPVDYEDERVAQCKHVIRTHDERGEVCFDCGTVVS